MPPNSAAHGDRQPDDRYAEIVRLVGALAHEIKNPLSTIRLNMDLLAEELSASDSPRDRRVLCKVEIVQRECRRLQVLLEDFLNFAKVRRLDLQPSDLNQELKQLLDFFRPKAQAAGIELIDYLASDLPTVWLDSELFRAALLNLLLNAEQAMPRGGQLVVRTSATADGVAVHLIDTGCGMDEKTCARIFDVFFSTRPGGSGLGLPTARKIIEGHGGRIDVQSAPGHGTQFTIHLPVPAQLPAGTAATTQG